MTTAPTITGTRVRLRPHRMADFAAFWAFYQSPRSAWMDAPQSRSHLWYGFASEVGSWALQGQGGWAIETLDGRFAGQVSLTQPPHFAERSLGWMLFDDFEGQGLAFEAANLARDYAWSTLRATTLVSYVHRDNARSIALAERLDARPDGTAKAHHDSDIVYRHSPPPLVTP